MRREETIKNTTFVDISVEAVEDSFSVIVFSSYLLTLSR
jgi:hypothetical protein